MKNKLHLFFISDAFSNLGGAIFITTIAIYIAIVVKDPILMGQILLFSGLARIFGGLFSGTLVDSYGAKNIYLISLILRVIISLFIFIFLSFTSNFIILYITIFFGLIDSFQWPALEVLKKSIFSQNNILRDNSNLFILNKGINILSPLVATLLISIFSYNYIFLLVSVLFFISIIFISLINVEYLKVSPKNKNFFKNFRDGLNLIKNNTNLCYLVILIASVNLCANGIFISLPYLMEELDNYAKNMTFMSTSMSIGLLIGGILLSNFNKIGISINMINIGFILQGVCIALVSTAFNLIHGMIIFVFIGISTSLSGIFISSYMQKRVPKDSLGRVSGIIMVLSMSTTPIAQYIFGSLIVHFSVKSIFLWGGLYQVMVCILFSLLFGRKIFFRDR